MIFLNIPIIKHEDTNENLLGLNGKKNTITVNSFINIQAIITIEENPSSNKLTNIHFDSGHCVTTPISLTSFMEQLTTYLTSIEEQEKLTDE